MFIFKNPRDKQVIENFAKQAFPGKVQAVREAYADATEEPHSYLMIDMTQTTPERVRLIGNYMRHDKPLIANMMLLQFNTRTRLKMFHMQRSDQRNRMRPTARIRKHFTELEYLSRAIKAVRSRMLSRASTDLFLAIVDVAKALINGEMQLTAKQLSAAKRWKTDILKLASKGRDPTKTDSS